MTQLLEAGEPVTPLAAQAVAGAVGCDYNPKFASGLLQELTNSICSTLLTGSAFRKNTNLGIGLLLVCKRPVVEGPGP